MSEFLQGATAMGTFAIALFFLKFWRDTSDRLFAAFSAAFGVFGVNRVLLIVLDEDSEAVPWVYLLRALMCVLISAAIVDKNVSARR